MSLTHTQPVRMFFKRKLLNSIAYVFLNDGFDGLDGRVDVGLVARDGDFAGFWSVPLGQLDVDGMCLPQLGDFGTATSNDLGMELRINIDGAFEATQPFVFHWDFLYYIAPPPIHIYSTEWVRKTFMNTKF